MAITTRALLVAALLVGVAAPAVAQFPADESERIARLWEQRRKAVSTAEYKLSWEWFRTRPQPGDPKTGENGVYTGTGTLLIDFVNNRIRFEHEETYPDGKPPSATQRLRQRRMFADDGVDKFFFDHRERFPGLSEPAETIHTYAGIGRPEFLQFDPHVFHPIFWAHGLVQTETPLQRKSPFLRRRPTASQIQTTGWEQIDGKPYTTVRIPSDAFGMVANLSVDSGGTGAVSRWANSYGVGMGMRCDISYRDTPYGSFPEGWKMNEGGPGRPLALYYQVRVESAIYNRPIPADEFRITFPPGTQVTKSDGRYLVQEDGQLLRLPDPPPKPRSSNPADARPVWSTYLPDWLSRRLAMAIRWTGWRMTIGPLLIAILYVLYARHRRLRAATVDV